MQFDVYINSNQDTCGEIPFLLDVQAGILDTLSTRVVVPLILFSVIKKPIKYLNPVFQVKNRKIVMFTQELAGIPMSLLTEKVANIASNRQEIVAAMDFLLTGF